MKKLLLTLVSAVILTSSATAVVACGFKEPVNVILELAANIARPNSVILKAYRDIVDAYNQERPANPIKVEVREVPANNVDNEIATGQPLPSLYVAYGDSAAKYETILNQIDEADKIVDLAQVINWDVEYVESIKNANEPQIEFIEKFKDNATKGNELSQNKPLDEITHVDPDNPKEHFIPLRHSFPREGSNNNKMYVAPTAKSGMNGVMNTRLINELVGIVSGGAINLKEELKAETKIRDPYFFQKAGITQWIGNKDLPLNQLTGQWHLPVSNNYENSEKTVATLFQEWFGSVKTVAGLQSVMQDLSKLEVLVLAYNLLVEYGGNKEYFKSHFSVAFDDVPGLIYTMQAALGNSDKQIYSWTNKELYKLTLYKKDPYSRSLANIIELFNWADQLRPLNGDAGNTPDHGYGGITAKLNSPSYYSNTWQKSGMLAYFGSTAGAGFWIAEDPEGTQIEDLELMSIPTYKVEGTPTPNFVAQQGPGMGMFKSTNQVKNEIAIDFVNYFLKAENNTKFAFAAGYIPSNYYAYYTEKGKLGTIPVEGEMGPYYQVLDDEAKNNPENPQIKGAGIVKKYVDSILVEGTQLWTQIPSPFGDAMRYQVLVPWFEANFKTVRDHYLNFEGFWESLVDQSSISSVERIVRGLFPIEGQYEIKTE